MADDVELLIETLRADGPVLLPTDTVYGLCASAASERAVRGLYRLKGREDRRPTALITDAVESLLTLIPELDDRTVTIVRTLLPGPYTLVVPNPGGRFPWLAGERSDAIGVRVPRLPAATGQVVSAVGAVAATSANDPGGRDPARLEDVPERIRAACKALDLGVLPGTASTVIDFTGADPVVLREGASSSVAALGLVRDALGR